MIRPFIACLALLSAVLAQNTTDTHEDDRSSGLTDFLRTGYPIVACVTGGLLFLYALLHAFRHHKAGRAAAGNNTTAAAGHHRGGWLHHPIWNLMNLILGVFGFFLIFGPDHFGSTYANGTPFNSPRAAIIGLQLLVQAALGLYAATAANRWASKAYALFGIFNFLCLAGSNLLFNYNQPIWTLDEAQCNRYFGSYKLQRCDDTGFLQCLRAMGTLALFCEGFLIVASLISYFASSHLTTTGLDHLSHPAYYSTGPAVVTEKHATSYPTSTTSYGTTGAGTGYGTGATSTTGHPAGSYTTTQTRVVEGGGYQGAGHPQTHVTHHDVGVA